MSGYKTGLLAGLAEMLAASGLARWNPAGAYPAGSLPAIFVQAVPPSPDAAVTLTLYTVQPAGLDNVDEVLGLQVRTRTPGADPRAVSDLDDALYGVLHGLDNCEVGGRRISSIRHVSGVSLGQDGNKRWAWSSNYHVRLPR